MGTRFSHSACENDEIRNKRAPGCPKAKVICARRGAAGAHDPAGDFRPLTSFIRSYFLPPNFVCYLASMSVAQKHTFESPADTMVSIEEIRQCFPALARSHNGYPVAYFDGPGGTQVPRSVVEAMNDYLYHH